MANHADPPPTTFTVRRHRAKSQVSTAQTGICARQRHEGEDFKKISAWAAILFAPTLVGTIYGMNFDTMPELHWTGGYPFAIGLMGVVCTSLYVIFTRRDWL